jgi:diguanylate cyclase (GGDEF)-like protein/PAS domain S-box-containing protein
VSSIASTIDRVVGADRLEPAAHTRLRGARARSIADFARPVAVGAIGAAGLVAVTAFGDPGWWAILAWAVLVVLSHGRDLLRRGGPDVQRLRAAAVPMALVRGALWGAGFLLLLWISPGEQAVLALVIAAAACGIGATLLAHPHAALAFVLPLGIGAVAFCAGATLAGTLKVAELLPLVGIGLLVPLTLRQSRAFHETVRQRLRLEDDDLVIDLLLADHGEGAREWLWGFDASGRVDRASTGLSATTFLHSDQLLGLDFIEFLSGITAEDDLVMQQLRRDVALRQPFADMELRLIGTGDESWWRLSGQPSRDESGNYLGYIGIGTDISERRRSEKRMSLLAHTDTQTGLYNRTKFTDTLNQCVARLERYGSPFALMYLDLDNFKLINDSRGHLAGDRMLAEVARRIHDNVRETDFAARLGGDEFALILTEGMSEDVCSRLAERLIEIICQPIDIDGEPLAVGVSIGIAIAPLDGTRPDQLQRNADLALYRAKSDGRSVYRFFESKMDADARERRLLEMELRDAIRNGELILHYQPLVSALDKIPTGFEALVRWQHPIRGLINPAEFIPIAERSSLIVEIGDWTVNRACEAAATWPDHLSVAVNLSAKHFKLSDISMVVRNALETSGLAPHRLELEITEGLLMADIEEVTSKLDELRAIGVTIVMDDFGTGYSSLSYLLKFPFDKIKIDRAFVAASTSDPMARDILRAISSLGTTLRLRITAEGVETPEQAEFLSEIACHTLQGFYFARPLDHIEMPIYLLSSAHTEGVDTSELRRITRTMPARATGT